MKKILLLLAFFAGALLYSQEPIQCQDVTIQLDENGEATITSSDVLVYNKGTLIGLPNENENDDGKRFQYDGSNNSLEFIEDVDICLFGGIPYALDRNPINHKIYGGYDFLDGGQGLDFVESDFSCGEIIYFNSIGDITVAIPLNFTFDANGKLYFDNFDSPLAIFDLNSNEVIPFSVDPLPFSLDFEDGITYDFDQNRILLCGGVSDNPTIVAANLDTNSYEELFSFATSDNCVIKGIEYVGNNTILMVGDCDKVYSLNLLSQEITIIGEYGAVFGFSDLLFIEDEIENTTLSQTNFTCDDIGENLITIEVLQDNGEILVCESVVTIIPSFYVANCDLVADATIDIDNSMGLVPDITTDVEIISSCSSNFTVTQDPLPGTSIPLDQFVIITTTITDEFGNTTFCYTNAIASTLGVDDNLLENSLSFYPNPTTNSITLRNDSFTLLDKVQMTDIRGRVIQTIDLSTMGTERQIDLSNYASGVYFAHITAGDIVVIKRVIKKS